MCGGKGNRVRGQSPEPRSQPNVRSPAKHQKHSRFPMRVCLQWLRRGKVLDRCSSFSSQLPGCAEAVAACPAWRDRRSYFDNDADSQSGTMANFARRRTSSVVILACAFGACRSTVCPALCLTPTRALTRCQCGSRVSWSGGACSPPTEQAFPDAASGA